MTPPNRLAYGPGLWAWKEYSREFLAWQACEQLERYRYHKEFERAFAREPNSWRKYVLRQEGRL